MSVGIAGAVLSLSAQSRPPSQLLGVRGGASHQSCSSGRTSVITTRTPGVLARRLPAAASR